MGKTFAHESYRDGEVEAAGSNRAFGLTVGGILTGLGALKLVLAGVLSVVPVVMIAAGAVLVGFGIAAPALLTLPHRLWLRLGAAIATVVNPIVLAILFSLVVTPLAVFMRLAGKRPLRLKPDPAAASYWIVPEASVEQQSSMRRQF